MPSNATPTIARIAAVAAVAAALAALPAVAANAQSPAEFYQGKSIDLEIGYSVGGGYDLYARLVARHLGAHIPGNPTIVPRNMEGAGSLRLANYLYAAAPRDGTVIGATSRGAAFDPLLNENGAQFDASKFSWIGSANNEVSVCVALSSSGIATFDDVLTKPLTIGSTGVGDDTYQFPAVMNAVLGTKFKMITGYPGGNDISLALERGEVQGRCGWSWSSIVATRMNWVTEQEDRRPGADVAVQTSRSARRAAGHGFGQDRRAAPDFQADLRAPSHGPAVCGAARGARRPPGGAAPGLHGNHDGQGVPRRRRAANSRSIRSAAPSSKRWSRKSTARRRRW